MKSNRPQQGSILISVLWSLFFLGALALVISSLIEPQLSIASRLRDRVLLRYLAEAGMKKAIIEIRADETEGFDALNDVWSKNEEAFKEISLYDEGYFSLEFLIDNTGEGAAQESTKYYGLIDEERKININAASAGILNNFFEIVGETSSQAAADISDSIIDWRDDDDEKGDYGAENSYYQSLDPGYDCKNSSFEVLEELLLVKEMTQGIFDKVQNYLTVYGKGKVNINTADLLVLKSLGMRDSLAEKVILFRKGNDGEEATEDDNVFENIQNAGALLTSKAGLSGEETDEFNGIVDSGSVTVNSDIFRGRSVGGMRDRDIFKEIVFVVGRDEKIRYWREN